MYSKRIARGFQQTNLHHVGLRNDKQRRSFFGGQRFMWTKFDSGVSAGPMQAALQKYPTSQMRTSAAAPGSRLGRTRPFSMTAGDAIDAERSTISAGKHYVEETTKRSAALVTVANVCARPVHCKTVRYTEPEGWFDDLDPDHVTKLVVQDVPLVKGALSDTVELLILPPTDNSESSLTWPSFKEAEQGSALGRHIVLTKGAPVQTLPLEAEDDEDVWELQGERERGESGEDVLEVLRRGDSVALLGHSGTGKSIETNSLLLPLFQNLLDPKAALQDMFYRVADVLYRFRSIDGQIVCTEVQGAGTSLGDLEIKDPQGVRDRTISVGYTEVVLVLHMRENERGPYFTHIPTLFSFSSEKVEDKVKTFHKAGVLIFFARPPHTASELKVLATALFHTGDQSKLRSNMGLPEDANLKEVLGRVQKRIDTIGPLAREVLGNGRTSYSQWKYSMETSIGGLLHAKTTIGLFDLPRFTQYYVAPVGYSELVLFGNLTHQLIRRKTKASHVEILRMYDLERQLAEAIVVNDYLLARAKPHIKERVQQEVEEMADGVSSISKWEYFRNPCVDTPLRSKYKLADQDAAALRKEHTKHTQMSYFTSPVPAQELKDFDPSSVYSCTADMRAEGAVAIASTDCTELSLFTCTTVNPPTHPFPLASLRRWVESAKPTKLNVFFMTNWADRGTRGVCVESYPDDDAVSVALFGEVGRFRSYIIRCGIYHQLPAVMLDGDCPEFGALLDRYTAMWGGYTKEDFETMLHTYTKNELLRLAKKGGKPLKASDNKATLVSRFMSLLEDYTSNTIQARNVMRDNWIRYKCRR